MFSKLFIVIIACIVCFVLCQDTFTNLGGADQPFHDEKDVARIETCVGQCLTKYPGVKEFIMQRSTTISGLQVMFLGEVPKLTIYTKTGDVETQYDVKDMSADEIEKLVVQHGCRKRTM
ncbi:selenoprotein [Acrasis kona]|uniref:Selenoprotein n=1 Tax=Acrasis kona TaxID=1008807 RepID=A0AAW2ZHS4_9EUKA